MTKEQKAKIGNANKGKRHTEESKEKNRHAHIGKYAGAEHWTHKAGKLSVPFLNKQAKIRDDYTCQVCGIRDVEIMSVDHIRPKSIYPELVKVLENLMCLCPNCHARKTLRDRKLIVEFKKSKTS